MTDIALFFDPATWSADIAIAGGDLARDDGLETPILISLFTDRRARADDPLPSAGADRRGWWGDGFADPRYPIGSRRWLLERGKLTAATAVQTADCDREALAWLLDDGVVGMLEVSAAPLKPDPTRPSGAMATTVIYTRPQGQGRQRHDILWDATQRSLSD